MKKYFAPFNNILFITLMLLLSNSCKTITQKENSKIEEEKLEKAINTNQYIFLANSISPQSFRMINLSYGYSLKISGDTIYAALPYYGKSYSAPLDSRDIGINFISTDFDYKKELRNDSWSIAIKTKDTPNKTQFTLNVAKSGYATLYVTENNRQNVSFNGTVEASK